MFFGMGDLTRNFSKHLANGDAEMACPCCGECRMDATFMHQLQKVRDVYGKSIKINSGYRCPAHNAEVSSTGTTGPHTLIAVGDAPPQAHAVDVLLYGERAFKVMSRAAQYGMTGLGAHQRGPRADRIIHLDDLPNDPHPPRPWTWTY